MDGITISINSILKSLIINFNTLLDCPARFSGEFNEQKIHCFVEYIEYYKRIKCIRDEQALQELQHLLVDHAYSWWMRRKECVETWSEALTILENHYSKKRPANKVYQEILRQPYEDYQCKYDFIDDKIELFSELSQPELLTEKDKLDIIFALLPNDVQNKIKFGDITCVKDLKKHLKLVKSAIDVASCDQANAVLSSETSGFSIVLAAGGNSDPNKESDCEEVNNPNAFDNDDNGDSAKEPVIKVRRTEDLMPRDVKDEDKSCEKIESSEAKPSDTNNTLHSGHENFQIDVDIMNQINNIIDETEMCIETINNKESVSSTLSQTSNSTMALEILGFQIEAAKQNESTNHQDKSILNSTKKAKKRCSYCRHFNHTSQICFKRAKHKKLFPERFFETEFGESNKSLNENEQSTEGPSEILPSNIQNNNSSLLNGQTTEISITTSNITNPTSSTTTPLDPSPAFTSAPVILNNVRERSINPILTTKLIPAINGKVQNKHSAAKLRNTNSPSPKCHQCGTLGFYKSICPNCSPIYNNNHK